MEERNIIRNKVWVGTAALGLLKKGIMGIL